MGSLGREGLKIIDKMQAVKKVARSGSLIVEELFGNKSKKTETDPAEIAYESAFNGSSVVNEGLVLMSELQAELVCGHCSDTVHWPMSYCRKGHICCTQCRKENCCRICKQTFVDTQNLALDRILSLIYLPCRYRDIGCEESVPLSQKYDHESHCQYREVRCKHEHYGCEVVMTVKDMFWHNKMCSFAHHPHKNVLPRMPPNTKSKSLPVPNGDISMPC